MLVEFLTTLLMMIGLFCTVSVKLPGTLLILLAVAFYGTATEFVSFSSRSVGLLLFISIVSELGGRILQSYWLAKFPVTREFSVNSAVCHLGGMLVCDLLLGANLGFVVWEMIAGKTFIPQSDTVIQVLLRLAGVAVFRFMCGFIMIVIIHMSIFL
ncbi:DUF456 family protein [Sporomusa acidovorans]|uniref:DUF456 family protein n=1 Tax=Sporomusa acidovorans TaxID=112900 RepID=UPI000B828106|nr:DUF456 family protein [Sporomusa acidovorans]